MIAPRGDKDHTLCAGLYQLIRWQTWASKTYGTLQTLDVTLSIHAGPRPGRTPLPAFSSLLPVWDKAEVLGPLLRILQFIHCIGEKA